MKQKRQTIAGCALPVLLLTLLLCVAQTASRPSTENEGDIAALPPDADNIEFHHVKVVDGVMHKDHPVVMYKEDFVSEDYDPSKNETKVNHTKLFRRQQRIRHHHLKSKSNQQLKVAEPQEKMIFDVLPETPLIMNDDDSSISNFEVALLVQPSKEESLQKYPKKYHSRQRRQISPYARHHSYRSDYYADQQHALYRLAPSPHYLPAQPQRHYQRYPVAGKKPKYRGKLPIWQTEKPTPPMSIDNRDNFSNDDKKNHLFHNSNPDDADFSVFAQPRPDRNNGGAGAAANGGGAVGFGGGGASWQSPPEDVYDRPPSWGASDSFPSRTTSRPVAPWSTARTTRRPVARQPPVTSSPARPTAKRVSSCVWAIVNCCSQGTKQIRYNCFEEFGCHGAFWGVNPCADNIRDNAIASLTR